MAKKSEIKYMWRADYCYGRKNKMGVVLTTFRDVTCYFNNQADAMAWVIKGYNAVQAKGMTVESSDVKLVKMRKTYVASVLVHDPNYSAPKSMGCYKSVNEKKALEVHEKNKLFWEQKSYKTAPDYWGNSYPVTVELNTIWTESK